jgi:hypothetical protein
MLFSIDEDTGSRIVGWVMPDNPATTPKVVVHLGPEHHVVIDAFVVRPLLREQGLHNTGVCGFVVDENNCPGVTGAGHLEIKDADNHILIYRRRNDSQLVDQKFLRVETQLFRSHSLDDALIARFQMSYKSLELLPEETTRSIFAIPFTNSVFASGRIFWRVWEPMVRDRNFKAAILLREPFEELSERLLILKVGIAFQREFDGRRPWTNRSTLREDVLECQSRRFDRAAGSAVASLRRVARRSVQSNRLSTGRPECVRSSADTGNRRRARFAGGDGRSWLARRCGRVPPTCRRHTGPAG